MARRAAILRRHDDSSCLPRQALTERSIVLGQPTYERSTVDIEMDWAESPRLWFVRRFEHNGTQRIVAPACRNPRDLNSIREEPWQLFQGIKREVQWVARREGAIRT